MANTKTCAPCRGGDRKGCQERWQEPSQRGELSKGSQPRQQSYSYKCPNRQR